MFSTLQYSYADDEYDTRKSTKLKQKYLFILNYFSPTATAANESTTKKSCKNIIFFILITLIN